jgi:predicted AAA+ superfamily ATPase
MNTKINVIINNYLDSEKQTDYALMINGKWGCGKTYYIEHDLKKLIEGKSLQYIYISLNGCEDFVTISNKITYRLLFKKIILK